MEITGAFSDADYGNVAMNVTFTCEGVVGADTVKRMTSDTLRSELSGDFTLSESALSSPWGMWAQKCAGSYLSRHGRHVGEPSPATPYAGW